MSTDADTTPTEQTILSDVDGTTEQTVVSGPQAVTSGTVIDRRWRADSNIASGGYGDVWKGWDLEQNRAIALKILRHNAGNNDPSAIARMRQEAEILKAMDHDNIVEVFGFGDSAFGHFMVMELLDGQAIDQTLDRDGPASSERVIPVAAQLLAALAEAHDKQILHRDIKPENIILVRGDDGREIAKLVDFGIAKAQRLLNEAEDGATLVQTRAGGFMGTPRYAAPEQAVGDPLGPNIDLFALGLVLAEWLTGRMRIDGERHADVMTQLLSPDEIDVSDVPYRWREWLSRMVAKNPHDRYQSAAEALVGLQKLVVELHQKADFLDDNPHVFSAFSESDVDLQDASFIDDNSPLELDYERVQKLQQSSSAQTTYPNSETPGHPPQSGSGPLTPAAPNERPGRHPRARRPEHPSRPLSAVGSESDEEDSSGFSWFSALWLVAIVIITFGLVILVITILKS
jgi:serine/threonine-protein kinase